jgi:hypothetical protein
MLKDEIEVKGYLSDSPEHIGLLQMVWIRPEAIEDIMIVNLSLTSHQLLAPERRVGF